MDQISIQRRQCIFASYIPFFSATKDAKAKKDVKVKAIEQIIQYADTNFLTVFGKHKNKLEILLEVIWYLSTTNLGKDSEGF